MVRRTRRVFQSSAGVLPAGHVIRVQLGNVALPWTVYARWAALFVLAGLIAGTAIVLRRHRRSPAAATDDPTIGQEKPLPGPVASEAPKSRSRRQQQRRVPLEDSASWITTGLATKGTRWHKKDVRIQYCTFVPSLCFLWLRYFCVIRHLLLQVCRNA